MSSVIYGSVIDGGPARTRRCSSKKGHSTTKDTKEHEENTVPAKTSRGHRAPPEGDWVISESAWNNFVFFVSFVVQLPKWAAEGGDRMARDVADRGQ